MLNEIKRISDSLKECGIEIPHLNSELRNVPLHGKMFKIEISKNCEMKAVVLGDDVRKNCKYIYYDSKNQFIATKIKFNILDPEKEISSEDIPKKISNKVKNELEKAKEFFSALPKNNNTMALFEFFTRYDFFEDKEKFVLSVAKAIQRIDPQALSKDVYVTYEIKDYYELGYSPINHDRMYDEWFYFLKAKAESKISKEKRSLDKDIFGEPYISNDKSLPRSIFGIFPISIFQKNPAIPCVKSYNIAGPKGCPISEKSKIDIHNTLFYLLDKDKKGTYWMSYPCDDGSKILMIVIVSSKTEVQKDIYKLLYENFSTINQKDDQGDSEILDKSKEFIKKLRGEYSSSIIDNPIILGLRIPSNGPHSLIYSKELSKEQMIEKSDEWVSGWSNYHPVHIKISKNKTIKTKDRMTINDFLKTINNQWNIRGDNYSFKHFSPEEGYAFFFSSERLVKKCIDIISNSHINLLIDMTDRIHNGKKYELRKSRYDVFKIPILISILLYKMGIKQKNYEQRTSYLLGKFFSHLNKLQKDYLKDNKVSKLAGSESINLLLQRPQIAVSFALQRVSYILKKVKVQRIKEYKLDKKVSSYYDYHIICQIAKELSNRKIPAKWSNVDRVLIGLSYFLNK